MKKAKIMLTAVGLLAVVGGTLALKAHRASGLYWCSTLPATTCPIVATTNAAAPGPVTSLYCTTDPAMTNCTKFMTVKTTI